MNVSVIGLGYIGLPLASALANAGHMVDGFELKAEVREELRRGTTRIPETDVRLLFESAIARGSLRIVDHLRPSDAYIICVQTPTVAHRADLRCVEEAVRSVAQVVSGGELIVLESTVPPGTLERTVAGVLRDRGIDPDTVALAHCPERLLPGAIVHELRENPRIVGGRKAGDAERARDLYATFVRAPIELTNSTTAEMVKLVENTYRDINVAFANELSILSEEIGVDVWEVIRLANHHPRVRILSPGPGVGGHCIPVDPYFLTHANPIVTELIQTARRVNERMPYVLTRRLERIVPTERNRRPVVALFGATYKANVDDTRESPTIEIERLLRAGGYETRVFDPLARHFEVPLYPSAESAIRGADALMLLVDHDVFRALRPSDLRPLMRSHIVLDARGFLDVEDWESCGFDVHVMGRAPQAHGCDVAAISTRGRFEELLVADA